MGENSEASATKPQFHLSILGPLRLENASGARIAISSKRSQALLGLLATSQKGERSRSWLESMLWCDRPADQAKASLRKELSNLRKLMNAAKPNVLCADNNRIWLDLAQLEIEPLQSVSSSNEEFLEGLDLPKIQDQNLHQLHQMSHPEKMDVRFCYSVQEYMDYLFNHYCVKY